MKYNILLGTLVMFVAISAVPSALAANTFYLDPQDSTGSPGSSTTVDLMLEADTTFAGYSVDIYFDNSIVNISGSSYILWGSSVMYHDGSYVTVGNNGAATSAGTYTLATLTLDGQSTTGISNLNFSNTLLGDDSGDPITHSATNGTYTNQATAEPDLVVANIDPSQAIFVDATNVFTVHVENQGTADITGSFDVYWEITNDASTMLASGTETITGLNAEEEKTFDFEWKPTVLQNTSVSAIADSGYVVTESDEGNNDLSVKYIQDDESGSGILPLSKWGYGGDEPLINYKSGEVAGDLIYTFGDSAYLSGYTNNWSTSPYTVNFTLGSDVNQISGIAEGVGSGTVKEARLYMYYNFYRYPDAGRPADPEAMLTLTFDGNSISTDAKYEDAKGFCGMYSGYKYGTFVYNVTSNVTGDGTYQVVLSNAGEGDNHGTSIYGMALLVIYEDGSKSQKEYHIAEGFDLLRQYYKSSTSGRYSYHVLPEDATSTVDMPEAKGGYTELFTVTHDAASSPDKSRLYFNTGQWSDPWTTVFGNTGTDIEDVTSLKANPNTVKFQDRGDGYGATNAILISRKGNKIDLGPDQDTEVGRHIMVPITANDLDQFYGTVEMNLSYTASAFDFVAIHSSSDSIVTACQDYSSEGILDISAWNKDGVRGDVVLATVELEVVDGAGSDEILSLTVDLFEDVYGGAIDCYAVPTTISIKNLAGDLTVSSTAMPNSNLGDTIDAILNSNGRLRHTGDDAIVISATVTDSGLGIQSVTVDLSSIGGSANALMSEIATGEFELTTTATAGINDAHTFVVTAKDNGGNTADDTTNSLTVYRRGDVMRNNKVDMGDAMYIARYTVGLESPDMDHFKFVGDVQPASDSDHTTNMADALFIARYTVGLEPAP